MPITSSRSFQSVIVEPDPVGTLRRFVGQVRGKTVVYTFSRPVPIGQVIRFHERYRLCCTDRQRGIEQAAAMERHGVIVAVETLDGARKAG